MWEDNSPAKSRYSTARSWLLGRVSTAAAIMVVTPFALADADGAVIEEIIVNGQAVQSLDLDSIPNTSSRLGLSSFETPAAIDIIDSETMTARGFKSVTEAAESLVGVLSGEAPGEPSSFSMRGFQQNQISVLRDGLRAGPANMTMRPQNSFNLERVEILKGPSAVLYGEGAVAGTVNMVTKKAALDQKTASELLVSYGRYDSSEIAFGVRGPMTKNAAYRLDIDRSASDGWVDDTPSESLNITGSILWALKENLEVTISVDYLDDELPSYWGTPLVTSSFAGRHALNDVIRSADGRTVDSRMQFVNFNVDDYKSESDHFWGRALVEWEVNQNVTIRNEAYYFTAEREWQNAEQYPFNPVTELIDRDRFFVFHDQEMFGNRLNVVVKNDFAGMKNAFVAGVDYSDLDFERFRGFPDGDSVDPLNPVAGSFGALESKVAPTQIETAAVYFEESLKVLENLRLVIGGRFDHMELVRDNFNFDGSFDAASSFERDFDTFSWRAGVVYEVLAGVAVYGQYATGQDPVGSNIFLVGANQDFDLTSAKQWEVGAKVSINDGRAEVTVAYYDIQREDILTQISQTEVSNVGSQESQGVEVSFSLAISDRWKLGGNVAYTDAKYGTFFDPDFGIEASGNTPANVPDVAANLWTSFSEIGGLPLEIGGGLRYIDDRFADSGNVNVLLDYWTADAFAAYAIGKSRLMLRVRNLTDETYSPWADVFYPNQIVLATPRTVEFSLHTRF